MMVLGREGCGLWAMAVPAAALLLLRLQYAAADRPAPTTHDSVLMQVSSKGTLSKGVEPHHHGNGGARAAGGQHAAPEAGHQITEGDLRALASQGAVGVVVVVCDRTEYFKRAMASFLKAARDPQHFPIVISQDGNDSSMRELIQTGYVSTGLAAHIRHEHDPGAEEIARGLHLIDLHMATGYVRISQHYEFVMRKMFDDFRFGQIVFLEEDMEIAPDFFSYFGAMLPVLHRDPDLFCVSAWNDNGDRDLVADPEAAFRTDFFPGLGWMLERELWDEVRDRWPSAFWDDFMRTSDVRKDRHCIRPEVSRSFTFGERGISKGAYYEEHLSHILLNERPVDWAAADLRYLSPREAFDKHLADSVCAAAEADARAEDLPGRPGEALRVHYNRASFSDVASRFRLMPDRSDGVLRTSYRGVIPIAWGGRRIFFYTSEWPQGCGQ